jgi:HAD superfamily hydrolase (TIGR01509 family)
VHHPFIIRHLFAKAFAILKAMDTPTRAIIFDCFGVIFRDAFKDFVTEHRRQLLHPESYYYDLSDKSDLGNLRDQELYEELAKVTGELPFVVKSRMEDAVTSLNHGTVRIIHELKPHFSLGLLSNISRDFLDTFLTRHDLHVLFEQTIASSEVGHLKPDREIFAAMAERIGIPFEEWLFIDDRPVNVAGAEACGIRSHQFTTAGDLRRFLAEKRLLPTA